LLLPAITKKITAAIREREADRQTDRQTMNTKKKEMIALRNEGLVYAWVERTVWSGTELEHFSSQIEDI
jgi:hypothetical protein